MLKRAYTVMAIFMSFSMAADVDAGTNKFEAFLVYFFVIKLIGWIAKKMLGIGKANIRSSGGLFSWFMSVADTTRGDKQIFESVWNSARNRSAAADQESNNSAYQRYQKKNEACFHQYYANQKKGTYEGYRAQNRANKARYDANKY